MTNIEKYPEAFENGIPKAGGRWSWNRRAITVKSPMVSGECAVLFDDGVKTTWTPKDFAYDSIAFLGFSDSAPVNQGAAAPQAAVVLPRGWMLTDHMTCVSASVSGCYEKAVGGCEKCGYAACAKHVSVATPHDKTCRCSQAAPAPDVAPPPSLKAAVQQEGLSIPPQTGTRHEWWEKVARADEASGLPASAKAARIEAASLVKADLAYDLEADAIRSNRVVRKAALKEMGHGDRACFDLRGLREFEAIKSAEHALYFWWGK